VAAAAAVLLAACSHAPSAGSTSAAPDLARAVLAPSDGWASAQGGTRGGADARPEHVFDVRNRAELLAALALGDAAAGPSAAPKIVRVHGMINLSVDAHNRPLREADFRDRALDWDAFARAYDPAVWGKRPPEGPLEDARKRSAAQQAATIVVRVPSNTTLVGATRDAGFRHGSLVLDRVDNVIVRQLTLEDAWDDFPAWDPKDNASGEWNSEYDNLALRGATHVWVDHCTFSDGRRPDSGAPVRLGRPMQPHDGLLDVTLQSNWVTVSWNHFLAHDKTNLVGGSDSLKSDEGTLKVTFHHNLWEGVKERAPRVRYGQVHVYNNLYVVPAASSYGYSIGVGVNSRIVSEHNVWQTPASVPTTALVRYWKGQTFSDRGSLHNGQPIDLLASLRQAQPSVSFSADVGWTPTLQGPLDAAAAVPERVRAGAGAGRW
jgi:pectate lyase